MKELKRVLDRLYNEMNSEQKINNDPVSFPHKFSKEKDIEIAAFISSCFAFGKVNKIIETLGNVFRKMRYEPYFYLVESDRYDIFRDFKGFKYRFVNDEALSVFFNSLGKILRDRGRLIDLAGGDILETAKSIYTEIMANADNPLLIKKSNLIPDISKGSPCKRLNLFFRWMVRKDNVDFGLWSDKIKPSSLIIPLDTHILRISRRLGFTNRKNSRLKTAMEITDCLRKFSPDDPVKYDFSLCHTGIQGICNSDVKKASCFLCNLQPFCIEGKIKEKNYSED